MPEGDTIHRTAAALRTALVGKVVTRVDAQRLIGPMPQPGRVVERVESHGKHLEIVFDDELTLHTHMRMTGSWHLYRVGERWRKPSAQLRVALTTDDWVAACFNAPVVETYRVFDRSRHPGFGRLGPDLCQADANLKTCVDLIVNYPQLDEPIGEVLLDQHVMCGVGNVYRSEILWACSVSPFHPVGDLDEDTIRRLVATGARQLRANLSHSHRITTSDVPGGLAVYGRNGQRCTRCGDTVQVRRTGPFQRVVYWCPGCQVLAPVEADISDEREMDPHPAAAKYLAELPWRRHDQVAG